MGRRIYTDITIDGVTYPDANAVARAKGVTANAVRIAIKRGTTHRIGTGAVGAEPMPILIRGRRYATARHAAKALGLTPGAVYRAINDGNADRLGRGPCNLNGARSKPVRIGPLDFPSMEEANRVLGFGPGYVSRALRGRSIVGCQRVLAAAMREAEKRAAAKGGAYRSGLT